jgi:putative aminopeptidase FrvX
LPPHEIDAHYLKERLIALLETPSPTGFAGPALAMVEASLKELGLESRRTNKGLLVADWPGEASDTPRALTAHVDTLGAMVKEIKSSGRLKLTGLGGFYWHSVEGETCQVFTREGKVYTGTILPTKASGHVHGRAMDKLKRNEENMEVRLDERVASEDEARALGIQVGDAVTFDPRVFVAPAGFIRSRHLDDKAGVACILAAVASLQAAGEQPSQRTRIHISHYEEVGHGAATGFPDDLAELVVVDMAAVGMGQTSDEFHVTICAKDSGGPYHAGLTDRLVRLASAEGIPHKLDIYPHYGSDGEAYWRSGGDVRVALVGPGVDASHHYERTHMDALIASAQLIAAYLIS